jgi:hypothetical protein
MYNGFVMRKEQSEALCTDKKLKHRFSHMIPTLLRFSYNFLLFIVKQMTDNNSILLSQSEIMISYCLNISDLSLNTSVSRSLQ